MQFVRWMLYTCVLGALLAAPATARVLMAQERPRRTGLIFADRLAQEQEIAIAFNREAGAYHVKVFSPEDRKRHLDLAAQDVKREELLRKISGNDTSEEDKKRLRVERDAIKMSSPLIYNLYRITRHEQDYLELRPVPPSLRRRMILPMSRISSVELPDEKTAEAPVE